MADYTRSKPIIGDQYPNGAIETTSRSTEPLITPDDLKSLHLFGIPLFSGIVDPVSKVRQQMTDPILVKYIDRAVAQAEIETGLTIFPAQFDTRLPFDRAEFHSWGYMRVPHRPVASVESITISPNDDADMFIVPLEWVNISQVGNSGQINIVPLQAVLTGGANFLETTETTINGVALIAVLQTQTWFSSFWKVQYTAGFRDGMIPKVVNDLIGTIAAMDALSMLASTFSRSTSASLSIDGLSQSTSGGGPQIFAERIKDLEKKRAMLTKKLKTMFGQVMFSGNV